MSSIKSLIFITVLMAIISTTSTCKLDINMLCETVKADLKVNVNISKQCTCEASSAVCDLINKGAPYDFQTLCPVIGKALTGQVPPSCTCDMFNKTCMQIDKCNAAHVGSMNGSSSIVNVMASSSLPVAMEPSSSMMMGNKTGEEMMSTSMVTDPSPSSLMMADKTPEPSLSSSMMMMMSSSVGTNSSRNEGDNSSANQIQIGRAAVSFCTVMAVLFYYMV